MSAHLAIALDLGTTSIKAGLLDQRGALGHIVSRPAPRIAAGGGCYESDALAYVQTAEQVLHACIAQAGDCRALGLCSQRSSFLIWEKSGGQPVTPLISWQDNRGASSCEALQMHEKQIRELTGLPLTPYYFAPKLRAVLQDNPGLSARLETGELLAGTLDTFLIWRWTGGRNFVTDASMAARTLLMDIRQQQWSPVLCDLFGIPMRLLPQIKSSAGMNLQLDNGLVLQASVGDQSAALIAGIENGGEALVNLGTGGFVVRYLADGQFSAYEYLRTLVYQDRMHRSHLAIEGTLNSIAAALAPYPVGDCQPDELAVSGIYCLAEPSGLGAPYFRKDIGLRFSQPVGDLTQRQVGALLLEAVIFRVARILEDFHRDSAIERVYLSGGLSSLTCLQQGLARCVPFDVYRLSQGESSLQGAVLLAAGIAPASNRVAEKVVVAGGSHTLPEKYRRWKIWLDALLQASM
ncbi:MAG: carbohydrate kinase [Nitrosomonadales bacterium]|nr:carbohydrate kinase [Nitrosomonadales bacterium]